jgi:flavin reductase (DIM6/NTAB) family NADH-FMN oxidoreductase RutF
VAVNRSTSLHGPLCRAGRFCLNLLALGNQTLVEVFSSPDRRGERFQRPQWQERHELDFLEGATCIFCRTSAQHACGTHELFIGEVFDVVVADAAQPIGWMRGALHGLAPLARSPQTDEVWIPGWDEYNLN